MDNNMNIDLRKKQITELVIKYYEESDFLKDKSLEKFIDKTLEKFLNSDLTIEQIEQRIIDAIEKKKQQLGKHDDSINEGNYELDNTKMAINVEEADNDFNSDLDGMLDNVDNTPEIVTSDQKGSADSSKTLTLKKESNHNNHFNEGGYANTLGVSTVSLIAFTAIMIIYILFLILF